MDLDTSMGYLNRGLQKMVKRKLLKIGLRYPLLFCSTSTGSLYSGACEGIFMSLNFFSYFIFFITI